MTALSATHPTLFDLANASNTDGKVSSIAMMAEILAQTNPILDDMPFKEANEVTGHVGNIRTGYPAPTWRKYYGGVQPTKSTYRKVTDTIGMLEAYAEVDKALADLNGNTAAFRLMEDRGHLEGMTQEMASTLFTGNELLVPEEFTGFNARFNSQSAENACNILTSAATPDSTDNSSLWLVVWGDYVHGIYPKGSQAGLLVEDKGSVTIGDSSNGYYEGYRTHYKWDMGLHVKDWRYVVRIQIDEEDLLAKATTGPDLIDLMMQATELIPNLGAGTPVFYANRNVRGFLRRQIMNKVANSTLSIEQIARSNGALIKVPALDGIPVRRCDALLANETGI
jgi:hypothetical protein